MECSLAKQSLKWYSDILNHLILDKNYRSKKIEVPGVAVVVVSEFCQGSTGATIVTFFSWIDRLRYCQDLAMVRNPYSGGSGMIHSSLLQTFSKMEERLATTVKCLKDRPVVFQGHAVGGALAVIGAMWFRTAFPELHLDSVCISGCPKVGNVAFREEYMSLVKCPTVRIQRTSDPLMKAPESDDYVHVGTCLELEYSIETAMQKKFGQVSLDMTAKSYGKLIDRQIRYKEAATQFMGYLNKNATKDGDLASETEVMINIYKRVMDHVKDGKPIDENSPYEKYRDNPEVKKKAAECSAAIKSFIEKIKNTKLKNTE